MDELKTYQFPSIKKLGNYPTVEVDGNNRINYFCKWYIDSGITNLIPPLWQDFVIRFHNYWEAIPAFKKQEISENYTIIVHYADDKASFIACVCVNDKKRYQVVCDYAHMEQGKIQFTVMCDSIGKSAAEQTAEAAVTSILAVQAYILYHKPEVIDVYTEPKPRKKPVQNPEKLFQSTLPVGGATKRKGEKEMMNYEDSAAALYDGGWRKEDHDELIEEYDLTEVEADEICELLAKYEERAQN